MNVCRGAEVLGDCAAAHTDRKPGNILPDSTAAPALQGQQRELQKHMRANSLEQKIQHRPKPEELIQEGILKPEEDPSKA